MGAAAGNKQSQRSSMLKPKHPSFMDVPASPAGTVKQKSGEIISRLRAVLEPWTQDSEGDIHLDVILCGLERKGECVHRLRERCDFPGFFEGLINFRESEATTTVRLQLRTPE